LARPTNSLAPARAANTVPTMMIVGATTYSTRTGSFPGYF
jgi:hypothetical protein